MPCEMPDIIERMLVAPVQIGRTRDSLRITDEGPAGMFVNNTGPLDIGCQKMFDMGCIFRAAAKLGSEM